MTLVSYAQNFEDVMLWRVLKDVEAGFYIDVGAAWPDEDSVTKAFYDMGWNGVNVEPNPLHHRKLKEQRARDINLRIAVGNQDGELTMNFVEDSGLSTLDDDIAIRHQQSGWKVIREQVPVLTLQAVWHRYVPQGQEVHFLKVDVEGIEKAVIEGNDWHKYRPWVVVVEATLPMLQDESYQSWEPLLLKARYLFAYADGLNRFYVAQEHEELLPGFKYPPNVFDGFKLAAQLNAEVRLVEAEARAAEAAAKQHALQPQVDQLKFQAQHWQQQASRLESERNALRESWSWRITAPLRFWAGLLIHPSVTLRRSVNHAVLCTVETGQRSLSRLMVALLRRPKLAYRINQSLMRYPALHQQLIGVARRQGVVPGMTNCAVSASATVQRTEPALAHLSPRARQIYADLKTAIESNRGTR